MAKKKKNKVNGPAVDLVEWSAGQSHFGTPTMVLLPSRKYHFRVSDKEYKITVPKEGKYHDLAPEIFTEEDGAFCLLDKENDVMYLPAISKVLFATEQYPDLANNQLFAPIALVFNESTVDIIGQIVEILPVLEPDK